METVKAVCLAQVQRISKALLLKDESQTLESTSILVLPLEPKTEMPPEIIRLHLQPTSIDLGQHLLHRKISGLVHP